MSEDPSFRRLNLQGVESSTGFTVQFTGRFELEYRKENFRMPCYVEGAIVEVPQLPYGNLTQERRCEIASEIAAALRFMELAFTVE
jgi:hypothetical protein